MNVSSSGWSNVTVAILAIADVILLVSFPTQGSTDPFRFPEGSHGKGELRYINDLPVMILEGTPEEIGE